MEVLKYFLITAGVLVCLSINIQAVKRDVLKYKLTSINYIQLKPNLTKTILRLNYDIYLKKNILLKNSYDVNLRNMKFEIEHENSKILNLNECLSTITSEISLFDPFLATYHQNGLLNYIKVHKREENLSVNLKLLASSLLQLNKTLLEHHDTSNSTVNTELTVAGLCPVNCDIKKQTSTGHDSFLIKKYLNTDACSELKQENRSEEKKVSCLGSICNPASQKRLNWKATTEMQLKLKNGVYIIEYVNAKECVRYSPWQNSTKEIVIDVTSNVASVSPSQFVWVYPFIDTHSSAVTKMWYRKVDTSICKQTGCKKDPDLKETYKALACDGVVTNIYLDIYEKAINCWTRL